MNRGKYHGVYITFIRKTKKIQKLWSGQKSKIEKKKRFGGLRKVGFLIEMHKFICLSVL